eukprot:5926722-Ditylum_brightwellii.AAC.1
MLKKRENAVLALDIRTLYDADIMCGDDWDDAKDALKEFYIDFYVNVRAYLRKKSNLQSKHSNEHIVSSTTTISTSVSKEPDKPLNVLKNKNLMILRVREKVMMMLVWKKVLMH